jgi:peptidoglycan/LPS O-acetylase OafA/YrhL
MLVRLFIAWENPRVHNVWMEDRRLPGLDGIRAISIALVLVHHIIGSEGGKWEQGAFGVEIFFVLSGFLITWVLLREEQISGSISLRKFYARRALRILPPVLTYIAALVVLSRIGWATFSLREGAACLFFVRNLFGGAPTTGHFWSLSVEEQFYLLWPAVLVLTNRRTQLKLAFALLLLEPVWRFVNYRWLGTAATVNGDRFDLHYNAILLGCFLALLRSEPGLARYLRNKTVQSYGMVLLATGVVMAIVEIGRVSILAYLGIAIVINDAVDHPERWAGTLNWAPIAWIGKLSYSIYIWQQLFCWKSPLGWLGYFPQNLIATLVMSSLSYYLVEQPFANMRKHVRFKSALRAKDETVLVQSA